MTDAARPGSLLGKAVVVTGAGRGIGAAVARAVMAEGASVVVNDIDGPAVQAVADELAAGGGRVVADVADVSSWQASSSLIDRCVDEFGAIDGLVNNAGLFAFGTPEEMGEDVWRSVIETNVLGTAYCGTHAIRRMTEQGKGSIVNVTSGAHLGSPLQSVYSASKGAVASLTYTWALDVGSRGIRVNALSPMAATRMNTFLLDYFRRKGEPPWPAVTIPPDNNAPVVTFLLSDDSAGVHGQIVRIDGNRLALMAHPAVLHPPLVRTPWTHDDIKEAFATVLGDRLQPVGVVGTTGQLVDYRINYVPDELQSAT